MSYSLLNIVNYLDTLDSRTSMLMNWSRERWARGWLPIYSLGYGLYCKKWPSTSISKAPSVLIASRVADLAFFMRERIVKVKMVAYA
jgi:hypothetical protein